MLLFPFVQQYRNTQLNRLSAYHLSVCMHGLQYTCRVPDVETLIEVYRLKLYHQLSRFLPKQGDVVIDVGANIGEYTLVVAKAVGPQGRVIAFEPNQSALALLKKNVHSNRADNIVVIPSAVADQKGTVSIYTFPGTNITDSMLPLTSTYYLAPAITLDAALSREKRIDIIKMDIEGGEYRALQEARTVLQKKPRLIMELHTPMIRRQVLAFLSSVGYRQVYECVLKQNELWLGYFEPASF